jgi:hypothetical protein
MDSLEGRMVSQAMNIDFALKAGVALRLSDIPYPEFLLLRQILEERERFQVDEMKKPPKR